MNKQGVNEEIVSSFLHQLGYSNDAVRIYLTLIHNGPSSLLSISKNSGLERTKLYRIAENLIKDGIITEVPAYKSKTYKAADLNAIELKVKESQIKAAGLMSSFGMFSEALSELNRLSLPKVDVVYYKGLEGMKQMIWHPTSCKGVLRTYSYRFWNDIIGDKFTLNLNQEFIKMRLQVRDLYSDQYIKYKEDWMKTRGKKPSGDWSFWESRFISEKVVKINQNIDIYNDTVAYSYWDGEDIFGVEIKNQRVADMQKQIHDVLWKMGKRVTHFDWQNPVWKKK